MDKVIIFGTTIFSRDMKIIMENEGNIEVVAYTVNEKYITERELDGIPVVPFETIEQHFSPQEHAVLNTLGYAQMNTVREMVFNYIKEKGYVNYTFISKNAVVYSRQIGEGSIIMPTAYIGPNVEIGKGNIILDYVSMSHRIRIGDFNYFAGNTELGGNVTVEDKCFIGMSCTVNNLVKLASQTFVAACSFISFSTEKDCAYQGNPIVKLPYKSKILIRFMVMNNKTI